MSDQPTIPNALPAEAWSGPYPSWRMATRTDETGFDLRGGRLNITASDTTHPSRVLTLHLDEVDARHALAALALHGQPFGFTREDVAVMRVPEVQQAISWALLDRGLQGRGVESLAARIEALLPPPIDGSPLHP